MQRGSYKRGCTHEVRPVSSPPILLMQILHIDLRWVRPRLPGDDGMHVGGISRGKQHWTATVVPAPHLKSRLGASLAGPGKAERFDDRARDRRNTEDGERKERMKSYLFLSVITILDADRGSQYNPC